MQIIMPKLGLTMTQGTITEWLKSPGDSVRAEEALCVYETEKVTLELSAPEDGVLVEILAPAGASVPAGEAVCAFRVGSEMAASPLHVVPDDPDFTVPFGQSQVSRPGTDVTIVAISGMLPKALEAAGILAGEGIDAEVVDPRTLVPLDKETIIASVMKTSRVLIARSLRNSSCRAARTSSKRPATWCAGGCSTGFVPQASALDRIGLSA